MKLDLHATKYGRLVQQLGDLDAYQATFEVGRAWFTTIEEAYWTTLAHWRGNAHFYQRDCPGRREARKNVAFLEKVTP